MMILCLPPISTLREILCFTSFGFERVTPRRPFSYNVPKFHETSPKLEH